MAKTGVELILSERLQRMLNKALLKKSMKEVAFGIGVRYTGKHIKDSSGKIGGDHPVIGKTGPTSDDVNNIPAAKGFGKWKSGGNSRTKLYQRSKNRFLNFIFFCSA